MQHVSIINVRDCSAPVHEPEMEKLPRVSLRVSPSCMAGGRPPCLSSQLDIQLARWQHHSAASPLAERPPFHTVGWRSLPSASLGCVPADPSQNISTSHKQAGWEGNNQG